MILLAATTQQALGIAVAVVLVLVWLGYVAVTLRRRSDEAPSEQLEMAPNRRPYLDDEGLEGPRLTRVLGWALVLLMITAIAPIVYWLREPSRQEGAEQGFAERAVARGESLFQPTDAEPLLHGAPPFGCATCHGSEGQGGVAPYTIETALGTPRVVRWIAPPLDTVLLRYSMEEVRTILVYGRANTPMPAWGVLGGGPMNDQQIDDLLAYIASIQLTPEEARERAQEELEAALAQGTYSSAGEALFALNCARCHTAGFSFGEPGIMGGGAFGPSLLDGVTVRQFPDREDMIEFVTQGSEFSKPYGLRGVGTGRMPGFGAQLTEEMIEAIVDYERSL